MRYARSVQQKSIDDADSYRSANHAVQAEIGFDPKDPSTW